MIEEEKWFEKRRLCERRQIPKLWVFGSGTFLASANSKQMATSQLDIEVRTEVYVTSMHICANVMVGLLENL